MQKAILKNKWFYTFLYVSATLNVQKSKFSQNFLQKPLLNEYKKYNSHFGFAQQPKLKTHNSKLITQYFYGFYYTPFQYRP